MINTWAENPEFLFLLHSHIAVGGLRPKDFEMEERKRRLPASATWPLCLPLQYALSFYLSHQSAATQTHTHARSTSTAEWSQVGRPFIFHANGNLVRLPIDWAPLVSQTMPLQSAAYGGKGGKGRRWQGGGRRCVGGVAADSCSDWFKRWIKSRYVPPPLYWLMTVARAALDYASWFNHQPLIWRLACMYAHTARASAYTESTVPHRETRCGRKKRKVMQCERQLKGWNKKESLITVLVKFSECLRQDKFRKWSWFVG